jgi:predicted phage-related endonuclease
MVQDIEDQMEAARKAEQSQMHEIDMEMRDVEKLKSEKQFLKSEVDKIEDEVSSSSSGSRVR